MATTTRKLAAFLAITLGLAGCENAARSFAPSRVPQAIPPTAPPGVQSVPSYTLTASSSTVAPGAELSVSWTSPQGGHGDWIGLFVVGAAPCDHGWSDDTSGATFGTLTLTAPLLPGLYEFRYHPNNSCDEAARSSPVRVSTGI